MKKLKENSFILSIVLLPFILLLGMLKMKGLMLNNIYSYLLIIMIITFCVSFIFSLFFALDEIINSNDKKRLLFVGLIPFIYIPIYYTKYVYKNEKYVGYGVSLVNIMLIGSLLFVTNGFVKNYMMDLHHKNFKLKDSYTYIAKNNLFSINVNNNFRCDSKLGDYVVACDNMEDDSFLGIYSYEGETFTEEELDDILRFHKDQTVKYINESNYQSDVVDEGNLVKIYYNNMVVLIKRMIYYSNDKTYCLIIVKEVSINKVDMNDFEKSIQNIEFLV